MTYNLKGEIKFTIARSENRDEIPGRKWKNKKIKKCNK